jgi:hypothetical protein
MANLNPSKQPMQWLSSAKVDTVSLLVAGPLISLVLLLAVMQGPAFLVCAVLFAVFLDLPHVLHTHVRLLANPADFRRVRVHFWGSLAALTVICVSLGAAKMLPWLIAIWVYWQPYHVCKQHFGVATMYARKAGYQGDTQHVLYLMLAGFAAPLMYRMAHGGFKFGDYELFGDKLPFANVEVPTPPVPGWLAGVAYGLLACALAYFVWREWRAAKTLPGFVWLMLAVSLALYNAAYLLVSDLYALILIGTSIHAIQYHLVCVSSVKAILPIAQIPADSSPLLKLLHGGVVGISGTRRLWIVLVSAGAIVLMTEVPTLGVVPLIIVLHHFYLDGVIWKRKGTK